MNAELSAEFCKEYTTHMNRVRQDHNASLARGEKEKARLDREKAKIIQSIKDGVPGAILKDDATRVQSRLEELDLRLKTAEEAPVLFHPNMAQRYHQQVQPLISALNEEEYRSEAAEMVRGLVDRIVLAPEADGKDWQSICTGIWLASSPWQQGEVLPQGLVLQPLITPRYSTAPAKGRTWLKMRFSR